MCFLINFFTQVTDFGDKEKDWQKTGDGKRVSENEGLKLEKTIHSIGNTENIKKVLKNQKGWNHSWITPNKINFKDGLAVRDVVPGPFISPKLIKVTPFLFNSTSHLKNAERIRRGIPDAWAEYLALNGLNSDIDKKNIQRELSLNYSNLQVTDFVWNELGLPLTQGIPDPWKPVLSDNYSCFGDERVDICLCNPTILKEPKCRIDCERNARKVKRKSFKREFRKYSQNELYQIPEQISKERKNNKYEEKITGRHEPDFLQRSEFDKRDSEILQESNNVIQCDVSGKITFQGKSFDGIGSLKFKYGQNGNSISQEIQKTDSHQYLTNFAQNIYSKLTQNSKIRDMVSNFEPKKQLSKLKNIFNGKKDAQSEDFGEEIKLICCKCSCPYFKVLPDELLNANLMKEKMAKNGPIKSRTEIKTLRKTHKTRCECIENKKRKDHLKTKIENDNSFKKGNTDDKKSSSYEIRHTENSIDSGNNADISDFSKNDEKSEKSKQKFHKEFKKEEKGTFKKRNSCTPCGKRLTRKISEDNVPKDLSSDLTDEFPSRKNGRKYSGRRKLESKHIQRPKTEARQRVVSYSSDVEIMFKDREDRRQFSDKEGISPEKNVQNGDEESFVNNEKKNLEDGSQGEFRTRGGGLGIRFSSKDSEFDKRETTKKAWCVEENRIDSFRKINEEDGSDIKLDSELSNKVWSSLLEESLDLISEPIGRKKAGENIKISEDKSSMKENKCYVTYCSDQLKKYRES